MRELKHVVIVGGGVAGLETVLALRNLVGNSLEIVLLAPDSEFVYRPYSVLSPFDLIDSDTQRLDLIDALRTHSVRFVRGALSEVKPEQNCIVTEDGSEIPYDWLVLAHGARAEEAVKGALTFVGERSTGPFKELLARTVNLEIQRLAFVVPATEAWVLPLYELALQTRRHIVDSGVEGVEITVITSESEPLAVFGNRASVAIRALLEDHNIDLLCDQLAVEFADGVLNLVPGKELHFDAVVSLPRIVGNFVNGLECDEAGFLPVDLHARVDGYDSIFAAGDCVAFPIKQGGISTQQADAAAEVIAQAVGMLSEAEPFRPVLRGFLLTGDRPRYMRNEIAGGVGEGAISTARPLWWPPGKIAGKYFAPFMAVHGGIGLPPQAPVEGIPTEVKLAMSRAARHQDELLLEDG